MMMSLTEPDRRMNPITNLGLDRLPRVEPHDLPHLDCSLVQDCSQSGHDAGVSREEGSPTPSVK